MASFIGGYSMPAFERGHRESQRASHNSWKEVSLNRSVPPMGTFFIESPPSIAPHFRNVRRRTGDFEAMITPPLLLAAVRNSPSEIQSSTAGSTLWQTVFVSFAVVLILLEVVRGYRLGLPRQLMRGAAVIAAYAAGYFGGQLLLPVLQPILKWPDFILSMIGGAILALVIYGLIASLGSILFKRTAQHSAGPVRLVYGLSGALTGIVFGLFFIWLILVGIRSVGSIADAQVQAHPRTDTQPPSAPPDKPLALEKLDADSLTSFLARLKNSVELGSVGDLLKKTDVTPPAVYQTLKDAGTVSANPENARRFLSFPGAVELSDHPKIVALRHDPEIADLIRRGRVLELLQHPRVLAAANDPTLVERVKQFDIKKALEFAAKKD
jgi:hypothetical protein